MKGTLFQDPIEFQLRTKQDEMEQGDAVDAELTVINRGNSSILFENIKIDLAYGVFKTIKKKEENPWKIIASKTFEENINIDEQEKKSYFWSLNLPEGCPITDKIGSLFFLYGGGHKNFEPTFLDLKVTLNPLLKSFLQTFETQFKFVRRYEKNNKDFVEVKLISPSSKEYPTLDHLLCRLRILDGVMQINYIFKTKGFSTREAGPIKVVNKKREYKQEFSAGEYLSAGGFPNRQCFNKAVNEALDIIKSKI